ncbi:polysaccharide deacetylase family protein [Halalkalicoccus sp. NIPERK01]|uniref:polysaccharide deacetylase family protein n=1 Tax=Halalkalicoccus sp. NIPERK01 TaxID=3053469 RepID=UPI00256EE899|nr:polysaccharide deacetylase family protein [Halalkalicoccus sp. NIPERK01]MDL5363591.1 polysaccharide deacetylase family protein [Halalkalicoccus sp. NIPERK01]
MTKRPNRRQFLAGVGVGSLGLAGCTDILGSGEGNGGNGNGNGNGNGGLGGGNGDESQATPPAIDAGELIDDFEDVENWAPMEESNVAGDGEAALTGSQSLRIENQGTTAGVFQAFPDGLDASGNHLSMAIRVDSPRPARVRLEVDAPARADQLWTTRTMLGSHEGWFRMDAGWTGQRGEPNLGNVQEMRIYIQTQEEEEIRFWIDDLRMTPAADQGYVILSFDDGVASQYERAFPILEEYGYQAAAAVIPNSLNRDGRLHIDQLREMRDAGWDISSHPDPGTGLAEVDPEEARNRIESDFQYLDNRGFPDGARHMFAPYHSVNQEVIDIAREYHETCFYFAGNNSNVPPTDAMHLSRVDMHDIGGFTSLIDMAAQHNQLAVGLAHGVEPEDAEEPSPHADITVEQLREVLDHIEQSNVEVITPSQLIDSV